MTDNMLSQNNTYILLTADTAHSVSLRPTEVPRLFNFFLGGFKGTNMEDIISSESNLRQFMTQRLESRADIKIRDFVCFSPYTWVSLTCLLWD